MADLIKKTSEELGKLFFRYDFTKLHKKRHMWECNYLDLWCLLSAVQLACRHPGFSGPTRKRAELLARTIFDGMDLSPVLREVARRGWIPEYDEVKNERTH